MGVLLVTTFLMLIYIAVDGAYFPHAMNAAKHHRYTAISPHHIHARSIFNNSETLTPLTSGKSAQSAGDTCDRLMLKCYTPFLSYIDKNNEICHWKTTESFYHIAYLCVNAYEILSYLMDDNAVKNQYRLVKACKLIYEFQQCVKNSHICATTTFINGLISDQNLFCSNIYTFVNVTECKNAVSLRSPYNWIKQVYGNDVYMHGCPPKQYTQLYFDNIKLLLFEYLTSPSASYINNTLYAEALGRTVCQSVTIDECYYKRVDQLCEGSTAFYMPQKYNEQSLMYLCGYIDNVVSTSTYNSIAINCYKFITENCPIDHKTGHVTSKLEFADIFSVYNMTYWHQVGNIQADIILHTENKRISKCNRENLIIKQVGCYYKYFIQINLNMISMGDYLIKYMCNTDIYDDCVEVYVNSPCPAEAKQLHALREYIIAQCHYLKVAHNNDTCPLIQWQRLALGGTNLFSFTRTPFFNSSNINIFIFINMMTLSITPWLHAPTPFWYSYSFAMDVIPKLTWPQGHTEIIFPVVCNKEAMEVYNIYVKKSNQLSSNLKVRI